MHMCSPLFEPTLSNLVAEQFLLFPHLATALTSPDACPLQELDNPLILIIEKKVSGMASIIPVLELALKVRSLKPAGSACNLPQSWLESASSQFGLVKEGNGLGLKGKRPHRSGGAFVFSL